MPARMRMSLAAVAIIAVALVRFAPAARAIGGTPQPSTAAPRVLKYFVTSGGADTGFRAPDRELAVWAFEAWARNSGGLLRVEPAAREEESLVRVYWAPGDGGTYGETHAIFVDGRRGYVVFVRPEVDALGPEIAARATQDPLWREVIVYLTCLHEIGHALGLEHTADERDIMYSFGYGGDIVAYFGRYRRQIAARKDIRTASGLSESDVERFRAVSR